MYGTTHPDNIVSQKVLLKIGLKEIGHSSNYGGSTVFKIFREEV
jgi:RimJ/RimL family protein N-acetyltransferase